jgi:hypothetical protein
LGALPGVDEPGAAPLLELSVPWLPLGVAPGALLLEPPLEEELPVAPPVLAPLPGAGLGVVVVPAVPGVLPAPPLGVAPLLLVVPPALPPAALGSFFSQADNVKVAMRAASNKEYLMGIPL